MNTNGYKVDNRIVAEMTNNFGEAYTRVGLHHDYHSLLDALLMSALKTNTDASYFRDFFKFTPQADNGRKLEGKIAGQLFEEKLSLFDKKITYDNWRLMANPSRSFSPNQGEIFLCCSAYVRQRCLEDYIADYILHHQASEPNLEFVAQNKPLVERLLRESKRLLPAAVESNHQLVRLSLPPRIEANIHYFGNQAIDVIGRDTEQQQLLDFLNCKKSFFSWMQIAGPAGQGKSRLAYELILEAQKDEAWAAGMLENQEIERLWEEWESWQPHKPHLMVLDYVNGRTKEIKYFLRTLCQRADTFKHPVRVLLLERQPWDKSSSNSETLQQHGTHLPDSMALSVTKADWFSSLCERYDGNDPLLLNTRFKSGILELQPLDNVSLSIIASEVANLLVQDGAKIKENYIVSSLEHFDIEGRPLYAYFLAQEVASGTDVNSWSANNLLDAVLLRERSVWWASEFTVSPPLLEDDSIVTRLAILATMLDGIDCKKAYRMGLIPKVSASDRRQAITLTGGDKNSGIDNPYNIIPPLKPHLLGEWYVLASLDSGFPLPEIVETAWRYSPKHMAHFTQRICQDFRDHPSTKAILQFISWESIEANLLVGFATSLVDVAYPNENDFPSKLVEALILEAETENAQAMVALGCHFMANKQDNLAFHWFDRAAEVGSVVGINNVGYCFLHSIGVAQDNELAFKMFSIAASAGNVDALGNVGTCYLEGIHVEIDMAKAFTYLNHAASNNSSLAMDGLGRAYKRVGKLNDAENWFKEAINAGQVNSYHNLASLYLEEGSEEHVKRAFQLYYDAAHLGQPHSMNRLGYCYLEGLGVEKNGYEAFKWFSSATEINNIDAINNLGLCYIQGIGTKVDQDAAFQLFNHAATLGDVEAMNNLARCYLEAKGVERNLDLAYKYFKEAAQSGHADAMNQLGNLYKSWLSDENNIELSLEWYQKAVDSGSPAAMTNVALCYQSGIGFEKNYSTSLTWFEKAASHGETNAITHIGRCYEFGFGVDVDHAHAFLMYQKGALYDDWGMFNLGRAYLNGIGVEKDISLAVTWLEKSEHYNNIEAIVMLAESAFNGIISNVPQEKTFKRFYEASQMGSLSSLYYLGKCFTDGIGTEQSQSNAYQCYLQASHSNHVDAMFTLAGIYWSGSGVEKSVSESFKWYLKAAENNNLVAMLNVGRFYLHGIGVDINHEKGIQWIQKSADLGLILAMHQLALCYSSALGVKKNLAQSFLYYKKAAELGDSKAMCSLGTYYSSGVGTEKNKQEAFRWYQKSATAGFNMAQFSIGKCYALGSGTKKDLKKSTECFKQSSDNGYTEAQVLWALYHLSGFLVGKSPNTAFNLFLSAAQAGDFTAMYWLSFCYSKGLGVEKNKQVSSDWKNRAKKASGLTGVKRSIYFIKRKIQYRMLQFGSSMVDQENF